MAYSEEYYLDLGGQQKGPFSFPQIKRLWDKRLIPEDTLYWHEGSEERFPVADLCESPKERKRRRRTFPKSARLIAVVAAVLLIAVIAYFAPPTEEGWKETNQTRFTAEAAYWKARGFVRDMVEKERSSVAFEPMSAAAITLGSGDSATVTVTGTLFAPDGSSPLCSWRVSMAYNPSRGKWTLRGVERLPEPAGSAP